MTNINANNNFNKSREEQRASFAIISKILLIFLGLAMLYSAYQCYINYDKELLTTENIVFELDTEDYKLLLDN
jgi:uncharacterized membrane protein (DUF485 family)